MQEISNKRKCQRLIDELLDISEESWGYYQFQRDILRKKIPLEQQKELILQAMICGKKTAKALHKRYPDKGVTELCQLLEIPVTYCQSEETAERTTFATYDEEMGIRLMMEPIERFMQVGIDLARSFTEVADAILAHELFHYIELSDPLIYTQQTKLELWHIFSYRYYSSIRSLSEIAAMSFSKEINRLIFNPYVLEVALVWPYDQERSEKLLAEVQAIEKRKNCF